MPSSFLCLPLFSVTLILNEHYLRDNNVPCAKGNLFPQVVYSLRTRANKWCHYNDIDVPMEDTEDVHATKEDLSDSIEWKSFF